MTSYRTYQPSGGRVALGAALAVMLGIATPLLTAMEMAFLMPVIMLSGVLMVFFYAYAGRLPAWLFTAVQLASATLLLDSTFMWMTMAAGTFPAILAVRGMIARRPFFEQLKVDIALYLLGLVGALLIAWGSFGGNMIGRAAEALKAQMATIPDALILPVVEAVNQALSGISGVTKLTVEGYREQAQAVISLLGEVFQNALPGSLLAGAALSGALTALWGNWLMARHGLATNESYIGITRWFLPREVTLGLSLMWVAAYIISETGYAAGEAVYMAAYSIISTAFFIQGLAAISRSLYKRGVPSGRRRFLVGLALALGLLLRLFNTMLFIIGAVSALFGSRGAIRPPRGNDDDVS